MPNWVKNRLTITGPETNKVIENITTKENDETFLDFNKIIRMPESLNIVSGSLTDNCIELYLTYLNPDIKHFGQEHKDKELFENLKKAFCKQKIFKTFQGRMSASDIENFMKNSNNEKFKTTEDYINYALQAYNNICKYGSMDWYNWRIENWGTKWNACETEIQDSAIYFETAWGDVRNLVEKLSTMFPENEFIYEWSEEQIGIYCGQAVIQNGKFSVNENFDDLSKKAYELAFEFWGSEELFKYNERTNTYDFIEESMQTSKKNNEEME